MIKQAPLTFALVFLVLFTVIFFVLRWMFHERLQHKDDLIASLKEN